MKPLFVYAAPIEGDRIAAQLPESLRLGVGKTEAALSLAVRLASGSRPDLVIAFGVCGAYRVEPAKGPSLALRPLDLCFAGTEILADEGVETMDRFVSLSDLGLGSIGPFRADSVSTERASKSLSGAPIVAAATVSTCSGSDARAIANAARSGASIENMEGASIARVCESRGVPWIELRCVSNYCGDRERGEWRLDEAATRLQDAVLRVARIL